MQRDNPDKFFEMVPTRYGPRFVARPETIAGVWHHDRDIAEGMIKARAAIKTLDASPPPSEKPAFAKPKENAADRDDRECELTGATWPILGAKRKVVMRDDPLPDLGELPQGRDDRIIAELPPLDDDDVHYELEPQPDGGWAVVVEPGAPDGANPLTGDRRRDPRLVKANRDAARYWRDRNGNTRDEQRSTLFVHYPKPGTKLVLEGPNDVGGYALVLVGPDPEDLNANTPYGASGSGQVLRSPGAVPPETSRAGDSNWYSAQARLRDSARLKSMNEKARRFWARGR
jgi:hypothetical protein